MQIPVLCYHSLNIDNNEYAGNDHIAFAHDLRLIHKLGKQVVPLQWIVDWVRGRRTDQELENAVGLSMDDGSWFDFHDMTHPSCGEQRGMLGILQDFKQEVGDQQAHLHATSFVIASPSAREELDKTCLVNKSWWGDEWWVEANASGLMTVENHSWDHLHPTLETVAHSRQAKNDFSQVDNYQDAKAQITQANDYIKSLTQTSPRLFAYPYGHTHRYLSHEFLPYAGGHGLDGAFTTEPRSVVRDDNPWLLPRYVCGCDWKSETELANILK